jgi:hypothetical protein
MDDLQKIPMELRVRDRLNGNNVMVIVHSCLNSCQPQNDLENMQQLEFRKSINEIFDSVLYINDFLRNYQKLSMIR